MNSWAMWTQDQDERLLELVRSGQTHERIAAVMSNAQRTVTKKSVECRLRRIRDKCRPLRGPAEKPHYVPHGHELAGVSRRTDGSGTVTAQWDKTRVAGADVPPEPVPPDFLRERTSVMQRGDGSTVVQWTSYKRDLAEQWEACKAAITEHCAEHVRSADPVRPPKYTTDELITLYPIGDPHVGMLSWGWETGHNFDLGICERELVESLRYLVACSPPSKRAKVKNLGDFFHAETNAQRTPQSGNKLDVDGRSQKVGKVGLRIARALIDAALTKHEIVEVGSLPGNHDPTLSFWLQECMRLAYANEPRVVVENCENPYQYDLFGKNLFGWHHGDGAKLESLPAIMAADVPELWGKATYRFIHTGHVHHKKVQEFPGCVVITHRTMAAPDAWHHHSGYRSMQSLDALTYHIEYGPQSSVTSGVERVRAALLAKEAA